MAVAFFAYLLTLVLRFDGAVPDRYWLSFWRFLPVALAIHLVVHRLYGLYSPMWRYASVHEARRVVQAGAVGGGAVVAANLLVGWAVGGPRVLPLSVATFGAVLTLLGSGAIRFQSRLVSPREPAGDGERRSVLIVGAGSAGSLIIKDLLRNPSVGLRPVGLVDDDRRKLGRRLHGVPVLGPRTAIPRLVEQRQADLVLLAIPSATSEQVREIAAGHHRTDHDVALRPHHVQPRAARHHRQHPFKHVATRTRSIVHKQHSPDANASSSQGRDRTRPQLNRAPRIPDRVVHRAPASDDRSSAPRPKARTKTPRPGVWGSRRLADASCSRKSARGSSAS